MLVSYWLFKAYSLKTEAIEGTVTKINVYTYAPVATGRPKAVVPSGRDRSWFMLIPMSNKARASH
jgi:hypothetical protein